MKTQLKKYTVFEKRHGFFSQIRSIGLLDTQEQAEQKIEEMKKYPLYEKIQLNIAIVEIIETKDKK